MQMRMSSLPRDPLLPSQLFLPPFPLVIPSFPPSYFKSCFRSSLPPLFHLLIGVRCQPPSPHSSLMATCHPVNLLFPLYITVFITSRHPPAPAPPHPAHLILMRRPNPPPHLHLHSLSEPGVYFCSFLIRHCCCAQKKERHSSFLCSPCSVGICLFIGPTVLPNQHSVRNIQNAKKKEKKTPL